MKKLDFLEIQKRIRKMNFPKVDIVIGIASGGTVISSIIAFHLQCPLKIISINYRDPENNPKYESPQIIVGLDCKIIGKQVLLVDDVSVSGKTLEVARELLTDSFVTTFVLKGKADISAFPEVETCVDWPWILKP